VTTRASALLQAASPKLTKIADRSGDNVRLVAGNLLASKNVKPTVSKTVLPWML